MQSILRSHEYFHYVVFILDEHYCKKKFTWNKIHVKKEEPQHHYQYTVNELA